MCEGWPAVCEQLTRTPRMRVHRRVRASWRVGAPDQGRRCGTARSPSRWREMLESCGSGREGLVCPVIVLGSSMADVGGSVGKVRPVLTVGAEDGVPREGISLRDDVVREGALRML